MLQIGFFGKFKGPLPTHRTPHGTDMGSDQPRTINGYATVIFAMGVIAGGFRYNAAAVPADGVARAYGIHGITIPASIPGGGNMVDHFYRVRWPRSTSTTE